MSRRTLVRAALTAASVLLVSIAAVAPAQASIGISSFSLTPSSTQAGGSSSQPGPNLTFDASFSSQSGDSVKDATLALAPGLLANPSVVPLCSTQAFNAGNCPDSSRIGSGSTTGTAWFGTFSLPTNAYLIQPQGSEPARVGLIVTFFDYPIATASAPVTIRTSPDVGLNIPLSGLPNRLDGVQVVIDALHLTIFGSVGGHPFTRNPTYCVSATSSLTADSYGSSSQISKTSSFTPTGCSSLPYSPTLAGYVAADSGDDGIGLQATVTQSYDQADNHSIQLNFPSSASPRPASFASACTNADIATCPPVGSATVTTPLLTNSLNANVVLVAHANALPTIAILVPQPFGVELDATPILTGPSPEALVSNVPNIPISSLVLNLPGGPNSLFRAGTHLCTDPQSWSGRFSAWSGASASPSAPAAVYGCPGTPASPPPTPTGSLGSGPIIATQGSGPTIASGGSTQSVGGTTHTTGGMAIVTRSNDRLTLVLGGGRLFGKLDSVRFRLPTDARILKVRLDGRHVGFIKRYAHGRLTILFDRSGRIALIALEVPHGFRAGKLVATITDSAGRRKTLRLSL